MKRMVAGAVLAGVAIFGGVGGFGDETVRDDAGSVIEGGGLGAFAIRVGDCFQVPDEGLVLSVEGVPCSQPHDAEAYAAFDLDGPAEYPGEEAVFEQAVAGCYDRFATFVGLPYEDSELDFYWLEPTEESWAESDDREILCSIVSLDGSQLTGSMQGSRR